MALTPIDYTVITEQETQEQSQVAQMPSKTWRIDLENGRIGGVIDGEDAIRQFIRKALLTARNRYLIYDDQYGEEITSLIGSNVTTALLDVEIPRLVREALMYDDRIAEIPSISAERYNSNSIHIRVTVVATDGTIFTEGVTI